LTGERRENSINSRIIIFSRKAGRPETGQKGVDVLTDKKPGQGNVPEEMVRVRIPNKRNREIFAHTELMMGANHIRVRCFDGVTRMGRIKGKIKKKVWIREGDILIVIPWSFQDDKCDIIYRYTVPQVEWLKRNGYL
jgi:translation initiation factor 1A